MSYIASTKKLSDVIAYVKRQFGDEAGVQITDADITRWVNLAQQEIFRISEPLKASTSTNVVSGQRQYSFPVGISILRIQSIYYNGRPLPQKSVQEAEDYVLDTDPLFTNTGEPLFWWEWAGTINLYPVPNAALASGLKINYIPYPAELTVTPTSTLGVPDTFYSRVLEYVMQQAYELDENFTASDVKAAQFAQNLTSMAGKTEIADNTYPVINVLEEDAWSW